MKYVVVSFLFLGLVSCSFPGQSDVVKTDSWAVVVPNVDMGGVQFSDSGISVSTESGNVSVGSDGGLSVNNSSGGVSVSKDGNVSVSWNSWITIGGTKILAGTGVKVSSIETVDMEKDSEVQKITDDINKIFDDIGKEEK